LCFSRFVHISIVFSISVAGATRVANLLGARQPFLAKSAAWLAVYSASFLSIAFSIAVFYGHRIFGYLFTTDGNVLGRLEEAAPIVAAFQVAYGVQGVVQGSLRGMGRQLSLSG